MPSLPAFKDYPITDGQSADELWQTILRHLIGQVSVEIIEKSGPRSSAKLFFRVWFIPRKDRSNAADADPKGDY
jgi:hypothetical protein